MTVKRSLFARTAAVAAAMSLAVTSVTVSADETETSPIAADEPMAIAENVPNPKAPANGIVYNLKGGAAGTHNVNGTDYQTKGSYTEAELLIGTDEIDNNRVNSAKEVADIYNQKYLLGIASDFSVFLEGNLTVRDSDAEGRVAVGGDVISKAGYNYQIANGDFATATPLSLIPGGGYENRKDFAHLIVGGHLEDINTLAKVERSSGYTENYGGEYYKPENDMFKRFVLNTNSPKTANDNWNVSFHQQGQYVAGHNHDGINADELSQFYAAKLIDFPATFEMLRDRSKALRNTGSLYNVGTATVDYQTKEDGNTKMVLEYKGDPTQTVVFEVTEWKDNISEIDIINPIDNGNVEYIINCQSENPKLANTGGTLRTYLTGADNKTEEISKIDGVETSNNNKASTRLLFNFFNAKKLTISNNFTGTVLAPDADVNSNGKGHLSGALIAKSYDGPIEFGYRPYRGIAAPVTGKPVVPTPDTPDNPETTSTVKVSKTDLSGTPVAGAQMKVYSGTYTDASQLEGVTPLYSWTSSTTDYVLTDIAEGSYTLYEAAAPDTYEVTTTLINFGVNSLGKVTGVTANTDGMYYYNENTNTIVVKNKKIFNEPVIKLIKEYEDTDLAAMDPAERYELLSATKFNLSGNGINQNQSPVWDDARKKAVVTFTANDSEANVNVAKGTIKAGTYILSEVDMGITLKGYSIPVKHSFECIVDTEGNVTYREADTKNPITTEFPEVKNLIVKFPVPVSKQDVAEGGKELAGASLSIYRGTYNSTEELAGVKAFDSWVSTEEGPRTLYLPHGDYTLYEVSAPKGYEAATTFIHFTVSATGEISGIDTNTDSDVYKNENGVIVIKNSRIPTDPVIKLIKSYEGLDLASMNENDRDALLAATLFELSNKYNATISAVPEWNEAEGTAIVTFRNKNGEDPFIITDSDYTLYESTENQLVLQNMGYTIAVDKKFDVHIDTFGNVSYRPAGSGVFGDKFPEVENKMFVDEGQTKLVISKQNIAGTELSGAQLQIKDASGTVVDSWTSGSKAHSIIVEEGTYTLHEVSAPNGYTAITDVIFSVDANNSVTVISTTTTGGFAAVTNPDGTVSITVTDAADFSGGVSGLPAEVLPQRPTDNVNLSGTPSHNPDSDKSMESSEDNDSAEDVGAGAGMTAQTAADSTAAIVFMAAGLAAAAAVVRKRRK